MASLSSLLQTKQAVASVDEENLDSGQVYVFSGAARSDFRCRFCWSAPSDGTAVIEIWGSSGSGGMMCCCGFGVPGNPGSYSKKTIEVAAGDCVSGFTGRSCGNASALCFRGCGQATCICTHTDESCMCAQGGRGGFTMCTTGQSVYCCYKANGFCATETGSGCGIICNYGSGFWLPTAYGGDINCQGQFSCSNFGHCNPSCYNSHTQYIKTSAGLWSTCPSTIQVNADPVYNRGGFSNGSFFQSIAGLSTSPTHGQFYDRCYGSASYCGCYESQGCGMCVPVGVPAPSTTPCSSVRDHGLRGGRGAVRIQFIASE